MPTSKTRLTICNGALDIISEFPITSLDEENAYARWLNRNFGSVVESLLRLDVWNFACAFAKVHLEPDPPIMVWRHKYGLPPDWIRILQPTADGRRGSRPLPYAVQGNHLLTNNRIEHGIEYIRNVQEPGEWDPLFASLVEAQLAALMAQRFTAKNSYLDRAVQLAREARDNASMINSIEGSTPTPESFDILRNRNDGLYGDERDGGFGYRW